MPLVGRLPAYLFTGRFLQILLHLPSFARLNWRLFRDRRVSKLAKAVLIASLVYLVSPFDLLPDFLLPVGQVDDLAIVLSGLWTFVRLCPPEVVREKVREISGR